MFPTRFLAAALLATPVALAAADYNSQLLADKPSASWGFETAPADAETHGSVQLAAPGPRPPAFPSFSPENRAATFSGTGASVRIKDPGEQSVFDFQKGDSITLEAWVQCRAVKDNQQTYIIGKGRTQNPGVAPHNQNWALRLRGQDGAACVSFLFRDERNRPDAGDEDWHRWTSSVGFKAGEEWHHVAVSYTFGEPGSVRGYVDGQPAKGAWDMGGPTELGPVVDDDEVWIGSSLGGSPGSSFNGALDEIAIHRRVLAPERIAARFTPSLAEAQARLAARTASPAVQKTAAKDSGDPIPPPHIRVEDLPKNSVRVEIFEHAGTRETAAIETAGGNDSAPPKADPGQDASWSTLPARKTDEYQQPAFAFAAITNKYNERGVKVDRSRPFLVRAAGAITLKLGDHKLLLRALTGARLALDGQQIAATEQLKAKSGDAESVPDQAAKQLVAGLRLLPPGHKEALATVRGDGQPHVFTLEAFVGGKTIRPEIGELAVAISSDGGEWHLLGFSGRENGAIAREQFNDAGWRAFASEARERIARRNSEHRRNPAEEAYWKMRHDLARQHAKPAPEPPATVSNETATVTNPIDHFVFAKLATAKVAPAPLADDAAFLRRLTLDTIGLIPTGEEVTAFLADTALDKRAKTIDRLLADPRWADHWVSYWQDVLAENPSMLKGTLNNTGPFRWWLHEALADNWPMDRFVTALISLEGSPQYGGAAGFGIATQNDLPMAAKAQIVSSAFLAMEMKCARCHDAPSHPFDQADLFGIAAMLQRAPVRVPASSLTNGLSKNSRVTVSLTAGQLIEPHIVVGDLPGKPLPRVIRGRDDTRERLAAALTDPRNERFAQVLVNRVWKQFIGFGIVEPVDDWESSVPADKPLLQWLGCELVTHDYDLKHIARLILNSQTYQRIPTPEASRTVKSSERIFNSPARRRMTAEQLVDSLFSAAGKELESEQLTQDPEDRQTAADHGNFGVPRRAWEFIGLSNERDRPALAKPRAQVVADVLTTFGWRESRTEPRSVREQDANVMQPALLANGTFGARIMRLSDDGAFTALALRAQPLAKLIEQLFLRVLSRPPTAEEAAHFTQLLEPGYSERLTGAPPAPPPSRITRAVSWANHLNPEASTIILESEKQTKAGDPPTPRLRAAWRERMEDALWALMLSPEFVYLP